MSDFTSPKKGSNIICRVSNATPEMVCKYVSRLPKHKMTEEAFRTVMGKSWFQNEHQAPEQWGLYYIDGKYYHPRFDRDITTAEAERYLYGWIKRLIVINPYTRFKTSNDNRLVESIVEQLEKNPDEHDLKAIICHIINSDEPLVVNEIIANALNNYSEVVKVQTIDKDNEQFEVSLLPNYKEIIKTKYNMTKKEYFDLFNDIVITSHQNESRQQIFYGAPGTGKSFEINKKTKDDAVIRTTFHPDSDYSTFVGAYKPTMGTGKVYGAQGPLKKDDGQEIEEPKIEYNFVPQAFIKAYLAAWKKMTSEGEDKAPQFLIIEEITRGNCAQIFGDLFQLLDRSNNNFSCYPIEADTDLQQEIEKAFNEKGLYKLESNIDVDGSGEGYTSNYDSTLSDDIQHGRVLLLPPNLFIWATMNTSDQSLFPIDSAFKRRWDWQYMPISDANKGWKIEVNGKHYKWWDFLERMNDQIYATTNSEDKKMGYFFCKAEDSIIDAKTFVGKVVFYVWNDVFKDFANEAGSLFKDEDGTLLSFNKFYRVINGKTEVREEKAEQLLKNLGVKAEGETIDVEELEKNAPANSSKNYLKEIVFPDGTIYSTSEMNHFDAYMAAIRKIGIDSVASVADQLKYRRLNRPLISAEKYDEIENSTEFTYIQEGNYYFVKGAKTYTLVRILEDLNELLNVGMTINN